jgi:pyruvate formate lyase activating enzyme
MASSSSIGEHPDHGAAGAPFYPLIVDIKRCSLDDGPGIRSVVFFKGCPLRCSFCQNPETQSPKVEIAFSRQRCIGEGLCVEACPYEAISMALPGLINRSACVRCDACSEACPSGALRRIGAAYEPDALAEVLLRDRHYYERSGGGVTLSGGEPTMFPDYVGRLLSRLKAEGVHVILETGGYFHDYAAVREAILTRVDVVYFSLKIADSEAHRRHTGKPNALIIENLRRIAKEPHISIEARIPLVPGVTDTRENLEGLVAILRDAGVTSAQLLPYNPAGVYMTELLGRPCPDAPGSFMKPEELKRAQEMFCQIVESARSAPAPAPTT